ncbi:MAG: tyrosine-type recombinase/integrase [Candidatus Electryonea clarkiae]|nr:tyrosine-type recombinase/integrase [Candidatus Electryonea clarkiae]MDP8289126.1 tyrosine-type recombinase/integrase [Candidatus Electryonea clarkiae]
MKTDIVRNNNGNHNLEELKAELIEWKSGIGRARKTILACKYALDEFIKFTGNILVTEVKQEMIEQFLIDGRRSDFSDSTVDQWRRNILSAFNRAKKKGYITTNPAEDIEKLKIAPAERAQPINQEQLRKLMKKIAGSHYEPVVKFMLWSGCRIDESCKIQKRDVDLKSCVVYIRAGNTKSKQNREIPFKNHSGLKTLLNGLVNESTVAPLFESVINPGKSWHTDSVGKYLSRTFDALEMPWATAHTLRHTFAISLLVEGAPVWSVSRLLGHSSVTITENTYAHIIPQHAEEVMGMLPY